MVETGNSEVALGVHIFQDFRDLKFTPLIGKVKTLAGRHAVVVKAPPVDPAYAMVKEVAA
mgnify:CR=1 FL=1